jgi:hypothetical protein
MDQEAAIKARMARADLLMGVLFVVLGMAIFYASWTMPRLENRGVPPLTVPGLVPGGLSIGLTLCGLMLAIHALRLRVDGGWRDFAELFRSRAAMRASSVIALVLIYALGLVGWLPFWAATTLFVFTFVIVFEVVLVEPAGSWKQSLPWAIGLALFTGVAVVLAFEQLFLVRLP